ncbi:EAL domain protein [compost metagenome]
MHKLKLDQSFVRGLPHDSADMAIVRSIVTLGHSMGIAVLAEGIEQAAQRDTLRKLGCDLGQGYFLGRPQPPEKWVEPPIDTVASDALTGSILSGPASGYAARPPVARRIHGGTRG